MKTDNLENELRNLKLTHLTAIELAAYYDQRPDQIGRIRMEAHIKQCFICERRLALLQEEREALDNREITADEVAFVERMMKHMGLAQNPLADEPDAVSLQEKLADYLRQIMASWRISFMREAVRSEVNQGEELWQWQSEDGKMQVRALMETNADLTIHFSSNEMDMEDTRLKVRLGLFNQEITLRRVSESEVTAKIAVPWQYRRGNLAELSIESLDVEAFDFKAIDQ
jgi:hypothetical protein